MKVLFVGDIVGKPGRRVLRKLLPGLRESVGACFVIVNGENSAGGLGITRKTGRELFDAGADIITLGNHSFAKREALDYVQEEPRILRPANYPDGVPGRGWGVFKTSDGGIIAVASLMGRTFMDSIECPFKTADRVVQEAGAGPGGLIFDIHAEATSEKKAMGWYLDGRVSAVVGTHTHVQTSDEVVLPGGTAYITDTGMTGVVDSVLGLDRDIVIERFKTTLLSKFTLAEGPAALSGVAIDIDDRIGRARSIVRVNEAESI